MSFQQGDFTQSPGDKWYYHISYGATLNPDRKADWREAWHPDIVQVWGRLANGAEDSEASPWLHGLYRKRDPKFRISEGTIYGTSVTGHVSQIGRIWHRMYPVVQLKKNPDDPKKPIVRKTNKYWELLTFFPEHADNDSVQFLEYLESEQKVFHQFWSKNSI